MHHPHGTDPDAEPKLGRYRRVQANEYGQERQHFLLSAGAVTLGESQVARMTEDEAYAALEAITFAENEGKPFCPNKACAWPEAYRLTINRKRKDGSVEAVKQYKCAKCRQRFTLTSHTPFARRKMPVRDLLYAQMVYVNAVSGEAALRLRRALNISYKSSFVLEGKLRETILVARPSPLLQGTTEIDGLEMGGKLRKGSLKPKGKETRVGVPSDHFVYLGMRERKPGGSTRVAVVLGNEANYRNKEKGTDIIRDNTVFGSYKITDEGFSLGYLGPTDRVKHKAGYQIDGVHTNGIESFFARVRRAERGVFYQYTRPYADLYGAELAWREDHRRTPNGEQWRLLVGMVSKAGRSARWAGYWQRYKEPDLWPEAKIRKRQRVARPAGVDPRAPSKPIWPAAL